MSQKLFNFPPECGETEKLFDADFSFRTQTDPSLMDLPDVPPDVAVPTQLLDDIQEGPGHDSGCQGRWLVLIMVQSDQGDLGANEDIVLTVHFL